MSSVSASQEACRVLILRLNDDGDLLSYATCHRDMQEITLRYRQPQYGAWGPTPPVNQCCSRELTGEFTYVYLSGKACFMYRQIQPHDTI